MALDNCKHMFRPYFGPHFWARRTQWQMPYRDYKSSQLTSRYAQVEFYRCFDEQKSRVEFVINAKSAENGLNIADEEVPRLPRESEAESCFL